MRIPFVAAALALFALTPALAAAEDVRPSQLACDAKKIGARDLADCLRSGADRANRELEETVEAAIKSIEFAPGRAVVAEVALAALPQ